MGTMRAILLYHTILTITVLGLPINVNNERSRYLQRKPDSRLPQPDEELYEKPGAFEFDMVLTDQQKRSIDKDVKIRHLFGDAIDGLKRKMVSNGIYKWPQGKIPYKIQPGIADGTVRTLFSAIKEWEDKTCLRFIPSSPQLSQELGHFDFVHFYPQLIGCSANVGRIGQGEQYANISSRCSKGTIIHELGHVIGFVHEQSRPDRDNNVAVIYRNILQNRLSQFEKYSRRDVNSYNIPYDIGSIMHYSSKAFSKSANLKTITTNDQRIQMWMGQRDHLSFLDAKLANLAYGCNDHCTVPVGCKNGAYVGSSCSCICPDGLAGPTCETVTVTQSDCSQVFTEFNGIIKSKNYPSDYGYDDSCYWYIKGPEHSAIQLTFLDFTTEDDVNCEYDYLELRVYGAYKVGQRYCGDETGRTVTHNSNTLLLHFKSDSGFSFRGFQIAYKIIT